MSAKFATIEAQRLAGAARALATVSIRLSRKKTEARYQVLEAAACRMGTHDLCAYFEAFGVAAVADITELEAAGAHLIALIELTGIEPAMALSALAREELSRSDQRTTGAYHTDFRLAERLARSIARSLSPESRVIDPASGAGILLVALTLAVCGHDRRAVARFLRHGVYAADLSAASLRGALLSLACLTDDLGAVIEMRSRWIVGDSLLLTEKKWEEIAPGGFDGVIANPPWERVRLTRHEFARARGEAGHYGSVIEEAALSGFETRREKMASYADRLAERHPLLLRGETDLYTAFMSLYMERLRPGGVAALLVPGGLIRSQGTAALRRALLDQCDQVEISIFDNKAKFFAIDTRFKFLALRIRRAEAARRGPILLTHEVGTDRGTEMVGHARISRGPLVELSPDLSIPEVLSDRHWQLWRRLASAGERMNDPSSAWFVEPCRELDMTSDRSAFSPRARAGLLPVIEGRHIHQFRFGAKVYGGGSGRAAYWAARPFGTAEISAQFYAAPERLSSRARARAEQWRVGFCDIAGQTNERAMMAAVIPPGVACGNKVPTLLFPNDPRPDRMRVWTAIANSFAFDWMLRRVLTTTINYFVLYGVPMPRINPGGLPWRRLAGAVDELARLDLGGRSRDTDRLAADLRIQIEVAVSQVYGLTAQELALMLDDFPLLDRGQPALEGEVSSSITRDTVLSALARRRREADHWGMRAKAAAAIGAVPYVPAQMVDQSQTDDGVVVGGKDVGGRGR